MYLHYTLLSNRSECTLIGTVGPKKKHDWFERPLHLVIATGGIELFTLTSCICIFYK